MNAQRITDIYATILEIIDFIVSRTSDSLAEILTKALPLVAPIPNAVSIYYVSQTALEYNWIQALAVAASIECMFFALTEVVLKSWESWHTDKQEKLPLVVSVSAFCIYFILVMALVYTLEVTSGHSIAPMAFPVVSVVAAVTLGVTRWHKRNAAPRRERRPVTVKMVTPDTQTAIAQPAAIVTDSEHQPVTDTSTVDGKLTTSERRSRLSQLLTTAAATTDNVAEWARQFSASERTIWRDINALQTVTLPNSGD